VNSVSPACKSCMLRWEWKIRGSAGTKLPHGQQSSPFLMVMYEHNGVATVAMSASRPEQTRSSARTDAERAAPQHLFPAPGPTAAAAEPGAARQRGRAHSSGWSLPNTRRRPAARAPR